MKVKSFIRRLLGDTIVGIIDYCRYPSRRKCWGGPFNGQQFRQKIFQELVQRCAFTAIFETGTYLGVTTEYMHRKSQVNVYSVESNARHYGSVVQDSR